MAGAVLTSQFYAWLVTGDIEPLLAARGLAAGWGAALAGAAFLPPWGALITGLIAGIAFPLVLYFWNEFLRLLDASATSTLGLLGGWGLLAVALLADGKWGSGWNGGATTGITGVFNGGTSGQLIAQLVGLLTLGLWGILWGLLLGGLSRLSLANTFQSLQQGEQTITEGELTPTLKEEERLEEPEPTEKEKNELSEHVEELDAA